VLVLEYKSYGMCADINSSCLIISKTARLKEDMYYHGMCDSFVPVRLRESYLAPKNYLYAQKSLYSVHFHK
jgi:hypothetical protein